MRCLAVDSQCICIASPDRSLLIQCKPDLYLELCCNALILGTQSDLVQSPPPPFQVKDRLVLTKTNNDSIY